jgi:hypothetical protein
MLCFVGDSELDGDFAAFVVRAKQLDPAWDAAKPSLSAKLPGEVHRTVVDHDSGATLAGQPLSTRGARISTPWGSLPLGELAFQLKTPHGDWSLDLTKVKTELARSSNRQPL